MQLTQAEWVWTDAHTTITITELSRVCGISRAELDELVEYGSLVPLDGAPDEGAPVFTADCVAPLRAAGKLRQDFDLDLFAVSLALGYLQRIDALERQVRALQAHLPRHVHAPVREGPGLWHEPHA